MKKLLLNRIKSPVILMMISAVIVSADIFADSYNLSFGKLLNSFFPCEQNPAQPIFCYTVNYDFNLLLVMIVIFGISLLVMIVKIILFWRSNKKL